MLFVYLVPGIDCSPVQPSSIHGILNLGQFGERARETLCAAAACRFVTERGLLAKSMKQESGLEPHHFEGHTSNKHRQTHTKNIRLRGWQLHCR